ncbi:hypothetical protein PINS_up012671 [Pythium insidiosum]|nr:hypothetical protein PINS_up012671 [Pythium insidiosum]
MQLLQSLGAMVSIAVPFTGYVLMPSLYALLRWAVAYAVRFWLADEVLGVPHLGKLYVVSFALLGVLLVWWNQWGATPRALEHEDPALDGADDEDLDGVVADLRSGADDDLPLTTAQTALARTLQLGGLLLLAHSTSSTESSLLLVALVLLVGVFESLGAVLFFWYHYEAPGRPLGAHLDARVRGAGQDRDGEGAAGAATVSAREPRRARAREGGKRDPTAALCQGETPLGRRSEGPDGSAQRRAPRSPQLLRRAVVLRL